MNNPATPNQRFPPDFAEVRPFFIENSSYFMTLVNLYYTNNIVKPQYGARRTGKQAPGRWACLEWMTEAPEKRSRRVIPNTTRALITTLAG